MLQRAEHFDREMICRFFSEVVREEQAGEPFGEVFQVLGRDTG